MSERLGQFAFYLALTWVGLLAMILAQSPRFDHGWEVPQKRCSGHVPRSHGRREWLASLSFPVPPMARRAAGFHSNHNHRLAWLARLGMARESSSGLEVNSTPDLRTARSRTPSDFSSRSGIFASPGRGLRPSNAPRSEFYSTVRRKAARYHTPATRQIILVKLLKTLNIPTALRELP